MWFRRKRRRGLKPFDESKLPAHRVPTVAEATDEGLILTEFASRMAVKNRFILKVLSGREPWSQERGRDIARSTLQHLARESDADAENLGILIKKLRATPKGERDTQGYDRDDLPNMKHRLAVSVELARRLRERSTEDSYLDNLVERARSDAWREVAANIEHNLDIEYSPVDADYGRHRARRMQQLVSEDLAALAASVARNTPSDWGAL